MNKKVLILLTLVFLFLVVGLSYAYVMSMKNAQKEPNQTDNIKPVVKEEPTNGSKTVFDLINMNKPLSCTFTSSDPQMDGQVFVLGKKMRGNFKIDDGNGKKMESYVVSDGMTLYLWGDVMAQGIKMNISELYVDNVKENNNLKTFNESFNYDCTDWVVDESYFVAPTDVTFTDATALQEMVQQEGRSGIDMCISCGVIPDETAKKACIEQYKCSE